MKTEEYKKELIEAIQAIEEKDILLLRNLILGAKNRGANVFVFGNGDSANNANHFASDLMNSCRISCISLNENISTITALANDFDYSQIFVKQLEKLLNENDLVIGISTSGNSKNVILAIEKAKHSGFTTVALTGKTGGQLAVVAEYCIKANTDNVEICEDIHWVLGHILKYVLMEKV